MSKFNDERQQDFADVTNNNNEQISPLSTRFLVAHSSPVHDSTGEVVTRAQDDSFQSSSSTSNSKSSSSTASRSSRLQFLMMHHHSAVNSPLMYSRCTSLGSLASYDIRSSCNESYTSECSSVKPSGLISPSDIPDSPPCEPELLVDEDEHPPMRPNNQTLTMNTTSSNNRTTMMSETVIEKTFVFTQHDSSAHRAHHLPHPFPNVDDDDGERLDEVIVYSCDQLPTDASRAFKSSYEDEIIADDTCQRYNSETDEDDSLLDARIQNEASFAVPSHENLSVITEESSFVDDMNGNDETSSIKILYDLIKKPHWTSKPSFLQLQQPASQSSSSADQLLQHSSISFSSNPSSLSLDSNEDNLTDDEEDYDREKGRQFIQRLIEETLVRRSVPTDYLHSTSCVLCPSNTPMTVATRSLSSSSSSSISASTKSCTCVPNRAAIATQQPQRSQSSPARPSSTVPDDSKRPAAKPKENTFHHTRSSYLRLRQAQQNKRLHQHEKKC